MTAEELETDISAAGRLFTMPAGSVSLDRPVLVTRSDLTLDGRGATLHANDSSDGLVFAAPELVADPALHWTPGETNGRWGFRTRGTAGLCFRGTPLDLGPAVIPNGGYRLPRGYGGVKQLQVDLWLRREGGTWFGLNKTLAGMRGPTAGRPGPWYVEVWDTGHLRLIFRDQNGLNRVGGSALIPASNPPELRVTFRLDLEAGVGWSILNDEDLAPVGLPTNLMLDPDHGGSGLVGTSGDGHLTTGPDLTYLGLRVSVGMPPVPQTTADWFQERPDTLFLLALDGPLGTFARWRAGAAGAGHPGYTSAVGHGLALKAATAEWRPVRVQVRDLAVKHHGASSYGAGLMALPVIGFGVRDCQFEAGSHGVYLPFGHTNSYPVQVDGIESLWAGVAGVQLDNAIAAGSGWEIKYARQHAVWCRDGMLSLSRLFYAASQDGANEPIEDVVRLERLPQAQVQWATLNFEGSAPRRSYYRLSPAHAFPTRAELSFCSAERADGPLGLATAVKLDAGLGTEPPAVYELNHTAAGYVGPLLSVGSGWGAV